MPLAFLGFLFRFNHKFVFHVGSFSFSGLLLWYWLLSFSSAKTWWNLINSNEIVIGNGMVRIVLDRLSWIHILLLLPWSNLLHTISKLINILSKWRLRNVLLIEKLIIAIVIWHRILIM